MQFVCWWKSYVSDKFLEALTGFFCVQVFVWQIVIRIGFGLVTTHGGPKPATLYFTHAVCCSFAQVAREVYEGEMRTKYFLK